MRFLQEGADIPDDLIRAVNAGEVTFLCGAGVSLRAGLPLFKRLTEQIYARLGEHWSLEAPERRAFVSEEFDRVLRSLERRTRRPSVPGSRVREIAATILAAPETTATVDHRSLLQLSRDGDGRVRLLTTNFDTLFERAAARSGVLQAPSHAGKALPKPGGPADFGILHLHGRIADQQLGLEATDLVLTSADFGDAYLRDGWASRYVEDRMRREILVLVGYGAEDAAFRLLLETLDADRERFRDLTNVYAIDISTDDSTAIWKAKGIKPIEFTSYTDIYSCLAEWAEYTLQPAQYADARLRSILAKLPGEASDFEREQASFLVTQGDLPATFTKLNPSLAWISNLAEWGLLRAGDQWPVSWVQRNFSSAQAIRDVVANLRFFGPDAAELLELRLRAEAPAISEVIASAWRFVIRAMRETKLGLAQFEWFDLLPRLRRGERSTELFERFANAVRPKLEIGQLSRFHDEVEKPPGSAGDLMSVQFAIGDDVSATEALDAWPCDASPDADRQFLSHLSSTLDTALADATDAEVELTQARGQTDDDVRSVADHPQNSYGSGFLTITRLIAELWTRLASKNSALALPYFEHWRGSPYRLCRRLALFAAANDIVTADQAADAILRLPEGELFLTSASVEVHRLFKQRWNEFPIRKRQTIEKRIRQGFSGDWLQDDTEYKRELDRCRFDLLSFLEAENCTLGTASRKTRTEICRRWPQWVPREPQQAGFHLWSESHSGEIGDPTKLKNVRDEDLIEAAKSIDGEDPFRDGDVWRAFCQTDPDRALLALEAEAKAGRWPEWAWRPLLWNSRASYSEPGGLEKIAKLLTAWPADTFAEVIGPASFWFGENSRNLDDDRSWPLWDHLCDVAALREEPTESEKDPFESAINHPAGRLVEVVLRQLSKHPYKETVPDAILSRLDRLVAVPGIFGQLARVRMARDVAFLFGRAPKWTKKVIVPLFDWSSSEALAAWSARKYTNHIGSFELFDLTKSAFLAMFARADLPNEELRVYSAWLVAILLANQEGSEYPLTAVEARAALRQARVTALRSVAHEFAVKMERAKPEQKLSYWREAVGPVFQGLWPLDVDLQTPANTYKLVQILRATGAAFPEAADIVIPFIQAERPEHNTAIYSIASADEALYRSSPRKMLDLLAAVVGSPAPRRVHSLTEALDKIRSSDPGLAETRKFQKLMLCAGS